MQVTHKTDHITHAVIGGQTAQSFGINDSPEFFRILSSSLYSDKKLAVIREILCNAWDAHIEFGKTDTAIEVTINSDQLVIRDFGPGMAHSDILKLYTTYGGTTKVANDAVTGGFGLGTKAPFAYADHFEVINCHKGKKHIYRMSLSNAEVNGRPSVMKIMDAICGEETGIQVTVDIDQNDRRSFEELVRRIARNGEMNVKLNGDEVSTLPFSQAPNGYIIVPQGSINSSSQIMVRYGHVIYPVELDPKFRQEWDQARAYLASIDNLKNRWNNESRWSVVLYAQPSEVSVTPSRETLSMTDQTIATIKRLLAEFHAQVEDKIQDECIQILKEAVSTIWADGIPGTLCNPKRMMPNKKFFERKKRELAQVIFDVRTAAWHFMCGENYPDHKRFYFEDLKLRVQAMIDQGFGDKILNQRFIAELKHVGKPAARSSFLQKRIIWPLIRDIKALPVSNIHGIRLKNLFVIGWGTKPRGYSSGHIMLPITDTRLPNLNQALPFLRKVVILSHNRCEVLSDEFSLPELTNFHGELRSNLCYIVPRQPAKVKEAKAFFETRGYTVLDITPEQVIEKDVDAPKAPVKPRRKGVPTISSFIDPDTGKFDAQFGYYNNDDAVFTETPEFVTMVSPNRINTERFGATDPIAFNPIIRLWGDRGAICPSRASYDKMISMGAKPVEDFVREQMYIEIPKSKLIAAYYCSYKPSNFEFDDTMDEVLNILRADETLRKKYKLPAKLPQRERDLVSILEGWDWDRYSFGRRHPELHAIKQTWNPSPAFLTVYDLIRKSPLINALHLTLLVSLIRNSKTEVSTSARKLLLFAMKG